MASGPIPSWQIDAETVETVSDFIFWGSKITADGDCSHEIIRRLLLVRKVMTNLDCILKSRDVTLPAKVCLVKAMVFPVVIYGCKSWTIKKAEHRRIDGFELLCWRRLLRVTWTARRSNQSILGEISPEYSLEGLMLKLKLQYFGHLMRRADLLEKTLMRGKIEGGRRRGRQRMRWLDGIAHHLILCSPLLFLLSIFPSIRVFSNESVLCVRWPKHWSFSFNISPSNEYSGLISFRTDRLDLLAVHGTLKSLLQHHSSKASILWCSALFTVQLSHPYMTTGKTIALTR